MGWERVPRGDSVGNSSIAARRKFSCKEASSICAAIGLMHSRACSALAA